MKNKIKVLFFTGNRSEFGLMSPVIKKVEFDPQMEYKTIVSGAHLSNKYGRTIQNIKNEKIDVHYKINLSNSNADIIQEVSKLIEKIGHIIKNENPDYFFILGDRYESYAAAMAAFFLRVPIAHSGGGNITQGGCMDDILRHSLSKLASLHFVTCKENADNIKKLGEEKWRIINSGSSAVEKILDKDFYDKNELENDLNINLSKPIIVFTQHPVSSDPNITRTQIIESFKALKDLEIQTIITYPNQDPGSENIIEEFKNWKNIKYFSFYKSLGQKKYFSLLNYTSVVVGNSSSGLLETPIFKIPAVNIGKRQEGRVRSDNVIDVGYNSGEIKEAITKALYDNQFLKQVKECQNPFGAGNTSTIIVEKLKENYNNSNLLKKELV